MRYVYVCMYVYIIYIFIYIYICSARPCVGNAVQKLDGWIYKYIKVDLLLYININKPAFISNFKLGPQCIFSYTVYITVGKDPSMLSTAMNTLVILTDDV